MDVIQASIPLFFLLIGAELLVAKVTHQRVYRLNDSISDLSCGTLSQISGIFTKLITVGFFIWVGDHWSVQTLFDLPQWPGGAAAVGAGRFAVALAWSIGFVLVDVAYYWSHRLSHEVNILWAGHVVHHSSEEYNLTVALRQSSIHGLFTWVFYIPLAILGMPWEMFVVCYGINLIYQFWIHTREVGRLGFLEWFMNTPSHHRVHHGVNPKYQDRNYAGVFIVWDRLFGSFVTEEEEPVYGITIPLASWNPIWANVHVFKEIWENVRKTALWGNKMRVLFGRPSWRPADIGPSITAPPVVRETYQTYDPPTPSPINRYVFVQFVVVIVASIEILQLAGKVPLYHTAALGFYVVLSLSNFGSLLENRAWVWMLELARQVTVTAAAVILLYTGETPRPLTIAVLVFSALSTLWVVALRRAAASATPTSPPRPAGAISAS